MEYKTVVKEVVSDIQGVEAAALIHKTGFLIASSGLDDQFWLTVVEVFKHLQKVSQRLETELHGVDIVLERYRVAARRRENIIAVVVSTLDTPPEAVDYAAYRLLEEAIL
ncbi:MAG: hypothetical protein QXK71_07080 [Pyrobaculum sp.]|jgi:predicted regulator of Ras-like GTPase activity (Roadblock/LC7/MglB family)